jgi:hypothetical protein
MRRSLLLAVSVTVLMLTVGVGGSYAKNKHQDSISKSKVQEGYRLSPIPKNQLNLKGKNRDLVGLGSYLVNGTSDCSGCHSFPQFLPQGDNAGSNPAAGSPFEGIPSDQGLNTQLVANYNVSHYLAGGQCFGPFMARNITPDQNGLPEGLTEAEFITAMRTGADVHCDNDPSDPICDLGPPTPVLQVMPWPSYHGMTDRDLKAIYAYLSALPSTQPCNMVTDGCPGFSGDSMTFDHYVYANTDDCPNPAPAQ